MAISGIVGTNCWTKAEDLMISVLVSCSSVHAFLSVADAPAALAGNMFLDSMGREPEEFSDAGWLAKFPGIIVGTPGNSDGAFALTPVATGSGSGRSYGASGSVEIIFCVQTDPTDGIEDQERKFKNSVGDVMEELTNKPMSMSLLGVGKYGRVEPEQVQALGPMLNAWVTVEWGEFGEADD